MQFKAINDHVMAYRFRPGSGPFIAFINSLGSNQSIWDDVIRGLPAHYSILTYDLRGQGASEVTEDPYTLDLLASDLIAVLEHVAAEDVLLCGVSIGGMISQKVAADRPDLLRGAIFSNTAARIGNHDRWSDRISAVQSGGMDAVAESIINSWFSQTFRDGHGDNVAGHKGMILRNSTIGYANTCAALRDGDLTQSTPLIDMPCVCIAGSEDQSVTPAMVRALAESIPNAALHIIDDAGHIPSLDMPKSVTNIILNLIDETAVCADRRTTGEMVRRQVLGDTHVDRASASTTDFDLAFQNLITDGAWGTIWASDVISRRERSMITLGLLAALGNFDEVAMHVRATARTGASPQDIQEVFQHVAIYAGVPRANKALKIAKATFKEMEAELND